MRAFFHRWRRKVGLATLLVAVAAAILCLRSQLCSDWIVVRVDSDSMYLVHSWQMSLRGRQVPEPPLLSGPILWWGSNSYIATGLPIFPVVDPKRWDWSVPYWTLILPLTLLSGWLIVWKARSHIAGDERSKSLTDDEPANA